MAFWSKKKVSFGPTGTPFTPWTRSRNHLELDPDAYDLDAVTGFFHPITISGMEGSSVRKTAALILDDRQTSAEAPIAVFIEGVLIGYLAEGSAAEYRFEIARLAKSGQYLEVPCRLWVSTASGKTSARATLDMPPSGRICPMNELPAGAYVVLPTGESMPISWLEPASNHPAKYLHLGKETMLAVRLFTDDEVVQVAVDKTVIGRLFPSASDAYLAVVAELEDAGVDVLAQGVLTGTDAQMDITLDVAEPGSLDAQRLLR